MLCFSNPVIGASASRSKRQGGAGPFCYAAAAPRNCQRSFGSICRLHRDCMLSANIAPRRAAGVVAALVVLVVLLALASLGTGPVRLPPLTIIDALFGGG